MWTGAGIGIAGIVMTAIGGGVMAFGVTQIENLELNYGNIQNNRYALNQAALQAYTAGSVLLGIGIGAVVAGAITTGISGHNIQNLKPNLSLKKN